MLTRKNKIKRKLVKISNEYYLYSRKGGKYVEVTAEVIPVEQFEHYGLDLFLYNIDGYWTLFEAVTGQSLFTLSQSRRARFGGLVFIPDVELTVPLIKAEIKKRTAEQGLSPRYRFKVIK